MEQRADIRVSDRDRQGAADRLRAAMDEGRLDLFEYDSRLNLAYQAGTYGELDRLFTDLPPTARPTDRPTDRPTGARPKARSARPARVGLPIALRIVWVVWAAIVAISLTTWVLVLPDSGDTDFWPKWLLIPTAMLVAVTLGIRALRR